MSVVNQMLRDLDRRQAGEQPLYAHHVQPHGTQRRKLVSIVVIVFMLALAASYGALRYFDRQATHTASSVAQAAIQSDVRTAAPIQRQVEAEKLAEAAVATEPVVAIADEAPEPIRKSPEPEASTSVSEIASVAESDDTAQPQAAGTTVEPVMKASVPSAPTQTPVAFRQEMPITPVMPVPELEPTPMKIDVRPYAPTLTAESEFRRAAALINQGRNQDARAALHQALTLEPGHEAARQTLAVLQIEASATDEAETLLTEGLKLNPAQTNFAIVLARLKLDRGGDAAALQVLREHAPAAEADAEYRAFTAALLQRLDRHAEAIEEYRAVLSLAPRRGIWWVGLGRSYEAAGQSTAAVEAYARARHTGTLGAGVAQFVDQKLQTLR